DLAKRFAAIADETGASIVLCPPATDIAHVAKLVHVPVFAQHVDAVEPGPTTGWMPPETLLEAGAAGTLINHSERKVAWEEMAKSIPRCQKLGLEVIACADDISEAETLAKLSPEYIAIEPPELIGGDVSVTTAKPEVISRAVDRIHAVNAVKNCLRIRSDDNVTIFFYPHTLSLAEDLATECFKVGADVLLNLYTDKYYSAYMKHLSTEKLRQPSAFCRGLSNLSTATF